MNNRQNVNTQYKFGDTDGFMLTDLDTDASLMLIPCDTAGNFSWTGVTRAPLTRNAMKTSNTSNQYSDLEPPWISIPQEDWTGGRGNMTFTKDTTRYLDGKRAQAAFNECIFNGPLDYYSTGFRKAITNCPGSISWKKLSGADRYIAVSLTPTENITVGEIYIHMRKRGNPVSPLVVELKDNLTGNILASHEYTVAEITDTLSEFAKFTFSGVALTSGTKYYICVHTDAVSTDNRWEVGISKKFGDTYSSASGTSYKLANYNLYYRIAETQTGYKTLFFQYEQLPFMIRQKIGQAPTLWINGDIGKVTGSGTNTITDSSKSWSVNDYKGARIGLIYQNGAQEYTDTWRTITSNTANSITVDRAWDITPSTNCVYIIVDTPLWKQITGHGLTSYVTDVEVIKGVVYFAQGDYVDIRKMRWNNGAFEWQTMTGIKASFLQSVRDSAGMMMYRGRNDGIDHKRTVERSRLLDWRSSEISWATISEAITTKDDRVKTVSTSKTTSESEPASETTTTTVTTAETEPVEEKSVTTTVTTTETDTATPDDSKVTVQTTKNTTVGAVTVTSDATSITDKTKTESTDGTKTTVVATETVDLTKHEKEVEQPTSTTTTTSKSGTVDGQQVTATVTESKNRNQTVTVDGNNKTTTTTETTTTTTADRTIVEPVDTDIVVTNTTKYNGVTASSDTTETHLRISEAIVNGKRVITTTETNDTTAQPNIEPAIRTSCVSEVKDFLNPDTDFVQYVITIGAMTSDNFTGKCAITLQESEDGLAFTDVQTVTAIGTGTWRIFAHCQYRYRRFILTAVGTNCTVNNISFTTSTAFHFEDPVYLKDNYGKITRLFEYGAEMYKSLWIAQEGMISSINKVDGTTDTYTLDRINIDELQTTAEMWNGKAMTTADVYLLWGWLNGLQRYYNTQIEGKGPDHDEGLPFDRQGRVSQIVSYPSNFFISIDAEDGYSCVMQFNQSGWHELYRAPNKGERIHDMCFQPIYGTRPDKLWLNVGDDVVWLSMPSKILYAIQDPNAEYTHESVLVSAWHTAGMTDIEKLWQTLKIMADYLDGKNCWIEADYQTDEEEVWHPIENWYTSSPSQKEDLNPSGSVNGKKLRYRLRLQTTDYHKTPKVNVVVLEAVGRVDIKMSYNFYFRNIKYKRDLNAEFEDIEPLEVQDLLDKWANDLKKLRMNSRWRIFDDKIVYLDAVQTSVLNELSEGYIGQITLNEL